MTAHAKPTAEQAEQAGFCKAVPPEPKRYAQCRNCTHFVYDASDYLNGKGELAFRKENLRCRLHFFAVQMGTFCSSHQFHRADRSDR